MCDEPRTPTALTAADLPIATSCSKGTYTTRMVFNCDCNNFYVAHIRMEMKLCLLNVYALPVVLCGAKTWSATSKDAQCMSAVVIEKASTHLAPPTRH